jgi:hypothetical protein
LVRLDSPEALYSIQKLVTQDEIDLVKKNAAEQGIDLTQITIFYGGTDAGPSQLGHFSSDGIPLASDGRPLSPDEITGFYHLGAD